MNGIFFGKPSDLLKHEEEYEKTLDGIMFQGKWISMFHPLLGTLGWAEMEIAMTEVLKKQVSVHDDWLKPFDLSKHSNFGCVSTDLSMSRRFVEYFDFVDGEFYIGSEAILKMHIGINRRNQHDLS